MLILVVMADTHLYHAGLVVPDGDVLIHAGDLCRIGSLEELGAACEFIDSLPHRHKIIVAGNHDRAFEDQPAAARKLVEKLTYLEDKSCVIEGVNFYGSPWTPEFNEWAFNLPRGEALAEKWALIPEQTDVLITHGPPFGIGDNSGFVPGREGCEALLQRVRQVRPKVHVFGHIHQNPGCWQIGPTMFVNATTDECLRPPTVIQYEE
jgi:Icc-related predicted phosphoesterase